MRRKEAPFKGRKYLIDINPLSRLVHDLDYEKHSCNIDKIIEPHIRMRDTLSQIHFHILMNPDYNFCKCCFKKNK